VRAPARRIFPSFLPLRARRAQRYSLLLENTLQQLFSERKLLRTHQLRAGEALKESERALRPRASPSVLFFYTFRIQSAFAAPPLCALIWRLSLYYIKS
jgi:hypothetical protein